MSCPSSSWPPPHATCDAYYEIYVTSDRHDPIRSPRGQHAPGSGSLLVDGHITVTQGLYTMSHRSHHSRGPGASGEPAVRPRPCRVRGARAVLSESVVLSRRAHTLAARKSRRAVLS